MPAYDKLEFFHLSLGRRVLHFTMGSSIPDETSDPKGFLLRDWAEFSQMQDSEALGRYLDSTNLLRGYSDWARFLTHIRCSKFGEAARVAEDAGKMANIMSMPGPAASFAELSAVRQRHGWEGCPPLLIKWQQQTLEKFSRGRLQM